MNHISKLLRKKIYKTKPWLIVGKGPSFDKIKNINLGDYNIFSLNSSIEKLRNVEIAHMIDFDVFKNHQESIYKNAKFILLPINPHFNNKPSKKNLNDLKKEYDVLKKIDQEGRLFWYNHLSKKRFLSLSNFEKIFRKKHNVQYFSAEAPFSILGSYGIKNIYSVGIDGGSNYSESFSKETLFSNGRNSFNVQFNNIIKLIKKHDITYSPIDANYPINIYIGSQEEQMLSVKVLEYSIKKRTPVEINVFAMHQANIKYPIPKDPNNRQRTPFSFQRFLIPELNKFSGRAIYLDSDMQVFKDIRQLYNLPMGDNDLLTVENKEGSNRDLQFSVMLLDCEKLKWSINDIVKMLDNGELDYKSLMKEMKVAKNLGVKIPYYWNCLEWFDKKETGLIHYTDMPTQPWVYLKNKNGHLWIKDLIDAIKEGFISINLIKDHIKNGWIRPSLLYQIENNLPDYKKLNKKVLKKISDIDSSFKAPYKFIGKELIKLNVGCGDKVLKGYINIDLVEERGSSKIDIIDDVKKLEKIQDNYADEVLSIHVIEHFYFWEIKEVLANWIRVTKPGGEIIIETPNLLSACKLVAQDHEKYSKHDSNLSMWPLYGDPKHKDPMMCHKWLFTPESLINFIKENFSDKISKVEQAKCQFKMKEPRDFRVVIKKRSIYKNFA